MGLAAKISNWERIRRQALDRDGWRCCRCGKAGRLEVHHLRRLIDGGDNSLPNLESLCIACHLAIHRKPVSSARSDWDQLAAAL